jgi:hypothetical protein
LTILTELRPPKAKPEWKPESSMVCGFCGEERHPGGTHLRVREVLDGSNQETTVRIPHVVVA